jgi:hypothetical protein
MTKEFDEIKFGKWFGVDYWLLRTEDNYRELQKKEEMYKELFGEPSSSNKYEEWHKQALQLSKISKQVMI